MCTEPKVSSGLILFAIFIGLIFCIYMESKWSNYKKRKVREVREETMPILENTIRAKEKYNVFLSDGRTFTNINILGVIERDEGQFAIGGWEGMVVLQKSDGKKVYIDS